MIDSAEMLWQLNNDYTQRLARASSSLELVGRLLGERVNGASGYYEESVEKAVKQLFAVLDYTNERLATIRAEHRDWRYQYYYESPDTKRIVQTEDAIRQAVVRFSRMWTHHERVLKELAMLLEAVPRPAPDVTSVLHGDLWETMRAAIADLLEFK